MRTKQIVLLALFGTLSAVEFSADDFEGDSWSPKDGQATSQTSAQDAGDDAVERNDAEKEASAQANFAKSSNWNKSYSNHDGLSHQVWGDNKQRYFTDGEGNIGELVRGVNNHAQKHHPRKHHHHQHSQIKSKLRDNMSDASDRKDAQDEANAQEAVKQTAKQKWYAEHYSPYDGLVHKVWGDNKQRQFTDGVSSLEDDVGGINNHVQYREPSRKHHNKHAHHEHKHFGQVAKAPAKDAEEPVASTAPSADEPPTAGKKPKAGGDEPAGTKAPAKDVESEPAPGPKAPKAKAGKPVAAKDAVSETDTSERKPHKSFLRDDTDREPPKPWVYKDSEADIPYGPYTRKTQTKEYVHQLDKTHSAQSGKYRSYYEDGVAGGGSHISHVPNYRTGKYYHGW